MARPISVTVNTYGTGIIPDDKAEELVREVFDLRPKAIIDQLGLQQPIYRATSNYGHLGNPDFPWEKLDKTDDIKQALQKYLV